MTKAIFGRRIGLLAVSASRRPELNKRISQQGNFVKRAAWTLVFGLLLGMGDHGFAQSKSIDSHLAVLSSPDAPGTLAKERIGTCLQQLLRQWKLSDKALPNIVVYHVSETAASAAYVNEQVAVRKNRATSPGESYFEIWLVGEPNIRAYVLALENVLESHFALTISDDERNAVMARVTRMQDATVSAVEGK
jgi:hypothetical protein